MPKEYDYSEKYIERDPYVKFRKCKGCNSIKKVEELEVRFLCSPCYTKIKGKKRCNKCYLRRPIEYFIRGIKKISTKDGYTNMCKMCIKDYKEENKEHIRKYFKEYAKKNAHKFRKYANDRRALKLNATIYPQLNKEIEEIYKKCPKGYEVDHIIPLKHERMCGLHVPWNLQYLTKSENRSKKNNIQE